MIVPPLPTDSCWEPFISDTGAMNAGGGFVDASRRAPGERQTDRKTESRQHTYTRARVWMCCGLIYERANGEEGNEETRLPSSRVVSWAARRAPPAYERRVSCESEPCEARDAFHPPPRRHRSRPWPGRGRRRRRGVQAVGGGRVACGPVSPTLRMGLLAEKRSLLSQGRHGN
jgi:hypothetical protein